MKFESIRGNFQRFLDLMRAHGGPQGMIEHGIPWDKVAWGWQLKKRIEQGIVIRELEKEMHMTKRTITRYINLCYLSPRIVGNILEYKNPANLTLRELMNLAEGQVDFERQEKIWYIIPNELRQNVVGSYY